MYFYNFCAVQILMAAILAVTALGGVLGLTDLSPLANIPHWEYTELGIHPGFFVGKPKNQHDRKFRLGTDGLTKEDIGREGNDYE